MVDEVWVREYALWRDVIMEKYGGYWKVVGGQKM